MIVITLVLWMWKTEALLSCSAILGIVGMAGALGEGDSEPGGVPGLCPPRGVFPAVGGGGSCGV